ncbi:hypothetical protein [Urechidicola vernalis]|uniref:Uncharacterized protein n=1 Tax=Urechidicola vernalis TaxID=3075600 RepID=A0ABU2Y348_9FLAO|nr:hypothetical protein [Urechidicola sp. P050]MDT0552637.1 hypothetical protein [Urechidicola sp. P050]
MKTLKLVFITILMCALLFPANNYAQEENKEDAYEPVILVVTTLHRNSDPDIDFSDWMKTEKEYFEKVTMKNEHILNSGFYFHYFTGDDTEVGVVNVHKSLSALEQSDERTNELIEEGWPDEDARQAFFSKQASYYEAKHSDEIYTSTRFGKPLETASTKPLIYYVKKNNLGNGGGKGFKEYYENVTMKNDLVKAYYTHRHLYGSNSQEFNEVFVFENFSDIEKSADEDWRLVQEHWEFEDERKEFFEGFNKIFSSHGDYIYQNVPELAK